jgi:hypothetical protein
VLGDADPTVWMVPLGGAVLGVLALLFVGSVNLTSMVGQTCSGSLAILRAGGRPAHRGGQRKADQVSTGGTNAGKPSMEVRFRCR